MKKLALLSTLAIVALTTMSFKSHSELSIENEKVDFFNIYQYTVVQVESVDYNIVASKQIYSVNKAFSNDALADTYLNNLKAQYPNTVSNGTGFTYIVTYTKAL